MTPRMRFVTLLTSLGSEGRFELIKTAVEETTVSMAFKPAARMVSPDSGSDVSNATLVYVLDVLLTNKVNDAVCHTQSTCCFDTAT